jgi:glycosyltransferase involved in cell wall biosynthesis
MHLVFVTSLVPDCEPTTGYEIANHSVVQALRRNGVKVTSLGFNWAGKQAAQRDDTVVLGDVDVRSETAGAADKANWVVKAFAATLPVSSAKLRIVSERSIREALAKLEPFDGFVINGVTLAGAFQNMFRDKPYLYVAHNVEYLSAEENAVTANSSVKRFFFRREAKLLEEIELALTGDAACTLALAEEDREPLAVSMPSRSVVLPLVTTGKAPISDAARSIEFDAGLIGTWTWQPNRVGLEWFLGEVAPHLPAGFSIGLAGHVPSDFGPIPPQVKVLGRVADAKEFVSSCAVIPLVSRSGTGVQLKTIETFEAGLPAVATRRSLRGIATIPSNCVVADDPKAFAEALIQLAQQRRAGAIGDADGAAFLRQQLFDQDKAVFLALESFRSKSSIRGSGVA